jgi:hypothetical protein
VVIVQAKGYVVALTGLELQNAFKLIRSCARAHQMKVRAIARAPIHGDLTIDDLRDRWASTVGAVVHVCGPPSRAFVSTTTPAPSSPWTP